MLKWIRSRKFTLAIGIAVVAWASLQSESESIASGEFLTDRIGEGSVLRLTAPVGNELDSRVVYFQDGHPIGAAQVSTEQAYCRFTSAKEKIASRLKRDPLLVVKFRNVARARWFFDSGIQLECIGAQESETVRETEFQKALGSYFQVEKHTELAQSDL